MIGIILLVCMYPFIFIMYFVIKNDASPKKGIYFGVNLSPEQVQDLQVQSIVLKYKREMKWCFFFMMVLPLLLLLIPWFSIMMTLWMLWLIVSIFIFFIPFGVANGKLKAIKIEKRWKKSIDSSLYTEIKCAGQVRKIHFYQFVGPCVLSLAAFFAVFFLPNKDFKEVTLITVGSFAWITILFYFIAVVMDRQKMKIVSIDSYVNINYARARKNIWKSLWISCAWLNTVCTVGILFSLQFELQMLGIFVSEMIMYCIAILVLIVINIKKIREVDTAYESRMDYCPADDDDLWLWGLIYYNPKDHHTMVEKRVGMGNSINLATAGGKWFSAFLGVILLGVMASCVWIIMLEFIPIRLVVNQNILFAAQFKNDYVVSLDSIENIVMLEDLPRWSRVNGTGMDNLEKGTFRIPEVGRCEVFVNPQNNLFIQFEANGTTYYMSGSDDEQTREVFEELTDF